MGDGTFDPIGTSDERMFGPRAIIASGFDASEQRELLEVLAHAGLADVPVCFANSAEASVPMGELAARRETTGRGVVSGLARAVVLSGVTEAELHGVMSGYRERRLPRPLWATLTEVSTGWTLGELLSELVAERAAIEGR